MSRKSSSDSANGFGDIIGVALLAAALLLVVAQFCISLILLVGTVEGSLPGQVHSGLQDAFVRKLSATGGVVWTVQFGSEADDRAHEVCEGSTGIYVAGETFGELPTQASSGGVNAFLIRLVDEAGPVSQPPVCGAGARSPTRTAKTPPASRSSTRRWRASTSATPTRWVRSSRRASTAVIRILPTTGHARSLASSQTRGCVCATTRGR